MSAAEVRECASEWPEFRKQFGEDTAKRFSKCAREAKSCPEVIGCAAGVVGRLGKDFEDGMGKMFDDDEPAKPDEKPAKPDDKTTHSTTEKSTESHTEKTTESHTEKTSETHQTESTDDDPFGEGPLPAECKRADEVCDKDERIARMECRRLVGNLKADPENLKELTTCYANAKNCFAFQKCYSEMWLKLH